MSGHTSVLGKKALKEIAKQAQQTDHYMLTVDRATKRLKDYADALRRIDTENKTLERRRENLARWRMQILHAMSELGHAERS